jgi:Polysaccharide pyruvyl transferase
MTVQRFSDRYGSSPIENPTRPISPMLTGRCEPSVSKATLLASNVVLFVMLGASLYLHHSSVETGHILHAPLSIATKPPAPSNIVDQKNILTEKDQLSISTKPLAPIKIEDQKEIMAVKEVAVATQRPLPAAKCVVKFRNEKMAFCNFVNTVGGGNFGDEIGPVVSERLVEDLLGCSAQNLTALNLKVDSDIRKNEGWICLFSLGSVFHKIVDGDHIWGTGVNPTWQGAYPKDLTIYAVRGKLTNNLLQERLKLDKAFAMGDPGFAIPTFFPEFKKMREAAKQKHAGKPSRFCFVPHAHDTTAAKTQLDKSIRIITVFQHWRPVVEALATECDYVASTSLHGIIESDALGIPTLWFQWENSTVSHSEGQFKYLDYFSTVNKVVSPSSDISQVLNKSAYAKPLTEAVSTTLVKNMKASFPYHLFETTHAEVNSQVS